MTFFLDAEPKTDIPVLEGPIPTNGDLFGAKQTVTAIDQDFWSRRRREEVALEFELREKLYGDGSRFSKEWTQAQISNDLKDPDLLAQAGEVAGFDPATWGNLPTNQADFDAEISRRLNAEIEEAEAVLGLRAPGFQAGASIFGGAASIAMTDETSLPLLFLGAGVGTGIKATIAIEAGLGLAGEAAILPKMFRVAEELDRPDPNVAAQLALGAVTGGAFGGFIKGAQRGAEYLFTRSERAGATVPEGISAIEHDQNLENVQAAMENDEPLPEIGLELPEETQATVDLLVGAEGFRSTPYWDVNAYRVGFGSDTITRADGTIERVTPETTITEADAYRDLERRVGEFQETVIGQVGEDTFNAFSPSQKAVLNSIAYNYGDLPDRILGAVRGGDPAEISTAILRLRGDNDGINAPRRTREAEIFLGTSQIGSSPRTTRAGYTTPDQVTTPTGTRIDVDYEIVDASTLVSARGKLQPRDRSRASSDEQIAAIASELDPARLMPSPEADRGAPIVGPDDMIESGNGRVAAIVRAAEEHPDRYEAYVDQISSQFDIPEGVSQPVLIARRTSELSDDARQSFVRDANTSNIARMSATEQSAMDAKSLSDDVLALYEPGQRLDAPENRAFVRAALDHIPQAERSGLVTSSGALNLDGIRRLQQGLFARAYDAPDLIARYTEGDATEFRSLTEALAEVAPSWASFRSEIASGAIKPEMDITEQVLDAIRLIGDARKTASRDGVSVLAAVDAALEQGDLLKGDLDGITAGFVKLFYKGDRVRNSGEIAEIMQSYITEARNIGRTDPELFGDALSSTPEDILNAIQDETRFLATGGAGTRQRNEKLASRTSRSGAGRYGAGVSRSLDVENAPVESFREGAGSEGAQLADNALEENLRAELANVRRADPRDEFADVEPEGLVQEMAQRQPFDTIDELYVRAAAAQERLLEAGQKIADDLGIEFKPAKLKDRGVAEAKIGRKGYTSPKQLTDVSRAGFIVDSLDDADRLAARLGDDFDGVDEGWKQYDAGYVDRKIMVRSPDGTLSEVQIWTREMLEAKKQAHRLYAEQRGLAVNDPKNKALNQQQREIYAASAKDFNSVAFSREGISNSPKRLANTLRKSSSDTNGLAVSQTSRASTDTQSAPGSRIASAKNEPGEISNSTAGRKSQLPKNLNSIDDTPFVGDTTDVSRILEEIKAGKDFEFELDGQNYRLSEMLDDLDDDADLVQITQLCASKGGGNA